MSSKSIVSSSQPGLHGMRPCLKHTRAHTQDLYVCCLVRGNQGWTMMSGHWFSQLPWWQQWLHPCHLSTADPYATLPYKQALHPARVPRCHNCPVSSEPAPNTHRESQVYTPQTAGPCSSPALICLFSSTHWSRVWASVLSSLIDRKSEVKANSLSTLSFNNRIWGIKSSVYTEAFNTHTLNCTFSQSEGEKSVLFNAFTGPLSTESLPCKDHEVESSWLPQFPPPVYYTVFHDHTAHTNIFYKCVPLFLTHVYGDSMELTCRDFQHYKLYKWGYFQMLLFGNWVGSLPSAEVVTRPSQEQEPWSLRVSCCHALRAWAWKVAFRLSPTTAQCYSPGAKNVGYMLMGYGENYKLSICVFSDSCPSPLEQTASLPCHDGQSSLKLRQTKSFLVTLLLSSGSWLEEAWAEGSQVKDLPMILLRLKANLKDLETVLLKEKGCWGLLLQFLPSRRCK